MTSYRASFFWLMLVTLLVGIFLPKESAAATPMAHERTMLWKVSGKGIKPSYLYGTFHLVPKEQFLLQEKIKEKLVKSESVVFEVDLDSPELTQRLSAAMRMDKPLETLMTPQEFNLLKQFVHDSLERDMNFYRYIKPGFLGQLLLYPKLLGYNPESYDLALLNLAKKWHKSIYALETPAEQVALFDQVTLENQTSQLLSNVKQFSQQRNVMKQMLSLYQAGDVDGLYQFVNSQEKAEETKGLMLDARNQRWITPLVNMMAKHSSFIAVGAAHLAGDQGLIELLRKQGYKVEPVLN